MPKLFHQSRRVALCAAIVLCVFINVGGDSPLSAQTANTGWAQVPAILARIKAPAFPNRDFKITDYGAVADGNERLKCLLALCFRKSVSKNSHAASRLTMRWIIAT